MVGAPAYIGGCGSNRQGMRDFLLIVSTCKCQFSAVAALQSTQQLLTRNSQACGMIHPDHDRAPTRTSPSPGTLAADSAVGRGL